MTTFVNLSDVWNVRRPLSWPVYLSPYNPVVSHNAEKTVFGNVVISVPCIFIILSGMGEVSLPLLLCFVHPGAKIVYGCIEDFFSLLVDDVCDLS